MKTNVQRDLFAAEAHHLRTLLRWASAPLDVIEECGAVGPICRDEADRVEAYRDEIAQAVRDLPKVRPERDWRLSMLRARLVDRVVAFDTRALAALSAIEIGGLDVEDPGWDYDAQ